MCVPIDICHAAAPDALALHSTLFASASCAAHKWEPFAFRLIRSCVVMYSPQQVAASDKFSNRMRLHALTRADVASALWMNAIVHAAPVESTIQALVSTTSFASKENAKKWVCSCCCYADEYALICAFFLDHGSNPLFIDVVTGSASACMPLGLETSPEGSVVACACVNEFVASTDAMSLFLYR
jgi:hypothetical protein